MKLVIHNHPEGDTLVLDADQLPRVPVARFFRSHRPPIDPTPIAERFIKAQTGFDELVEAASGVVENAEPNPEDPAPHPAKTFLVPAQNIEILKEALAKVGVS